MAGGGVDQTGPQGQVQTLRGAAFLQSPGRFGDARASAATAALQASGNCKHWQRGAVTHGGPLHCA